MAQKVILTSRMRLTLLESAELGSSDLDAMHKLRSNKEATLWSFFGQSKSIEDTQRVTRTMLPVLSGESSDSNQTEEEAASDTQHSKKFRAAWIAHARVNWDNPDMVKTNSDIITSNTALNGEGFDKYDRGKNDNVDRGSDDPQDNENVGGSEEIILGAIGLKEIQLYPDALSPSLIPAASPELLRMELGYMFLPEAWGKGYAAEASKAVIESYKDNQTWWGREIDPSIPRKRNLWIACVIGPANTRSVRVAEKVGLDKMGTKSWDGEKVFLGGKWQESKVVVYGKMLV